MLKCFLTPVLSGSSNEGPESEAIPSQRCAPLAEYFRQTILPLSVLYCMGEELSREKNICFLLHISLCSGILNAVGYTEGVIICPIPHQCVIPEEKVV